MKENYDYSMYTAVCTIKISSARRQLLIQQANNRTQRAGARYFPKRNYPLPLDFYYNKDSGNLVYGKRMIHHYKQHPPHEKYIYVSNFVEDLYALHQRSLKGEPSTQDDTVLRAAITSFLTSVYPFELSGRGQASATQYAFILPSQEHTSKDFINTTLRPLLQTTPWLTPSDPSNKAVFYSELDSFAYMINTTTMYKLCLERETKYLFCTLQKTDDHCRLVLTANFIRAVYDPDLIAASGRSMTALGRNTVLSAKMTSQPASLDILIEPTLAKMDSLAMLLYKKVFEGEEEEGSDTTELAKYYACTDSNHRSLIHHLICAILISKLRHHWSDAIDVADFYGGDWSNWLNENMKSRLSRITYGDFMQLFDDAIDIPSIAGGIDNYLQKHGNEELFRSIILAEVSEDEELVNKDINPYMTHNLAFAKEYCQRFYLLRVIKAIDDILQGQKKSKNILKVAISPRMSAEACVYKIWNIVQLSNRLGRPVVMEAVDKIQQESSKCAAIQKEKLAVLDRIQPYGYYVEARINCTNKVKLSLNQVIETATDNDTLQRSTLSIKDVSYQASDMYDSIFDAAWNIIDEHMANPQCKSLQQDDPLPLDCYKMIRADFIDIIKSNFESKSNAVQNLDEVIYQYNAKPNCACDLMVTHRLVINTGLLPYLRRIASEIAGPLISNAMFGDYRISCLYITGEFLYKWIEKGNPTYGELIWDQLQKAINAELYSKQLRIHLMMVKSMVLEDKALNYEPFKLERYKQVLSKHYFLQIDSHQKDDFRIYHDKGDHWVEVPFAFELDYVTCWTIPILPVDDQQDQSCQAVCKDKFYIVISPMITDQAYCRIRFYTLSKDRLEDVDDPEVLSANLTANIRLHSLKCEQQRCTFPLEVFVSPCSYMSAIDIQMRLGKGFNSSNAWGYHGVAYPERLTLQKMTFE